MTLTSFELHIFQGGGWKLDSIYDDKSLAVEMARRLLETRRIPAVRVVEESFADDGALRTRTVFRQSVMDAANAEALEQRRQIHREAREARLRRRETRRRRLASLQMSLAIDGVVWLLVRLIGISALGLVLSFVVGRMILPH